MKYFKIKGLWSISENDSKQLAGTLSYSKKGVSLDLQGSFRKGWSPISEFSYPIIKGIVEKNSFGNHVTLYDCHTKSTSMNHVGVASESIVVSRGVLGDDHLPLELLTNGALSLGYTHLADWVGWKNFSTDWHQAGPLKVSLLYKEPEKIAFQVDQVEFSIGSSISFTDSTPEAKIKESTYISIGPIREIHVLQASDNYAYRIQNLLTFATDTPNGNDSNVLYSSRSDNGLNSPILKEFHILSSPIYRSKGRQEKLFNRDMLFTLDDARESGINIFQRWFDFVSRHETFTSIYFAHIYRPAFYLDDKFRDVVKALYLYCDSAFPATERAKAITKSIFASLEPAYTLQEQQLLESSIPSSSELDMPFHLERLLHENKEIMSKIISEDFANFVVKIGATLSKTVKGSSIAEDSYFKDAAFYYAIQKLRWLLKVVILKELGFSSECVNTYLDRNKLFNDLKSI